MEHLFLLGSGLHEKRWEPLEQILSSRGYQWTIANRHEDFDRINEDIDLGILLGYKRIVPEEILKAPKQGFILFHSSDLPRGRGWAPIYNTVTRNLPLTQSLLFANTEIDAGPIIAKAHYPLDGNELEKEIRQIDDELTTILFEDSIDAVLKGETLPKPQNTSDMTLWRRRYPVDSQIDPERSLVDIISHLRGLPSESPGFFYYKGRRFMIRLEAEDETAIGFTKEKVKIERNY